MAQDTRELARHGWVIPRVLAFHQDVMEGGAIIGSVPVRWGVMLPDRRVATWPIDGVIGLTIYADLDTAALALDAWPAGVDQRHVNWRDGVPILMPDIGGERTAAAVGGAGG